MSASIRERALCAIVAALANDGTPAQSVSRSKLDNIELFDLPCFDVTPGDVKITEMDRASVEMVLPVTVRAIVDASTQEGESPDIDANVPAVDDSALDPFYVFAVQQLVGNGGNLGGLVTDIEEMDGTTVFRPGGRDLIGLEMTFDVKFSVKRGDPTQKG